ncbi:MAG: HAD family hydrolase [Sedimentisphaerales bacterium]|nr:HAD family hydrolase [Sedimentisphaerales bacterium]
MSSTAVFFDRDGTLIRDPGCISHPDQVELLDGAADAIKEVQSLGYRTIVVSNQPAVAKGILTEETVEQIHRRLREEVCRNGASLDAIYYCPYHPDGAVLKYRKDSDWRKPRPGMLLAAATDLDLDLAKSWMVGDNLRDVEAGRSAGCKTILISSAHTSWETTDRNTPDHVAVNMREAVNIIKKYHRSAQDARIVPVFANRSEPAPVVPPPESELPQQDEASGGSPMKASSTENQLPAEDDAVEQLLGGILEQLRLLQKREVFDEFSLTRLLAGILQVFVPFCLLVALWLLMNSREPNQNVLVALGFAAVLQGMALTFYIMNWRR